MLRIFQFIRSDQENITIEVPKNLKGKLVEIIVQEKAPDPGLQLDPSEEQQLAHKEEELIILDQVRNQLNVWD